MNGMEQLSQKTLEVLRASLAQGYDRSGKALAKGVTISTGLVNYDLMAPAKQLYPIYTPLRNMLPRVGRKNPGDAAHWKQIASITGSGYDAMGWVPEGQRAGPMSYQADNKSATYVTIGEEDYLTFEAEAAAEGFEDENAKVTFRLLQKMMQKEERGLLGGNASLALGTPGVISTSASGTGGTLPTLTYDVTVVALTFEGWKNSTLAAGIATSKTITGMDGSTFVLNGGSSNKAAVVTQAITLGQHLLASVPAVDGAVAYGWFIGAAGASTLQAITTLNSLDYSLPIVAGRQVATAITADNSRNANLAFDGLLTNALDTSKLAYRLTFANGVSGVGTKMTASGRGSVVEIDNMLQSMWDNYLIGPDIIWVNSQQQKDITTLCLTSSSGPLLRYEVPTTPGQAYGIVAGGVIDFYYNPYLNAKIPVKVHPDCPPGTIMAYCNTLPTWYQSNEVPNVAEILTRRDYYRMDWPLRTRRREYGVYAEEVLAVYATFGMGVLRNIGSGT